jgi:hypothetical protein
MTVRHIAVLAMAATVLTAGTSFAAGGFDAQLNEAKAASTDMRDRDTRDTISIHLSVAESLQKRGQDTRAAAYLNYARGMLGLPLDAQPFQAQTAEKAQGTVRN